MLVLPLATACCERGFSTLKRIKSDWRSRLRTETLDHLMRISIDGPDLESYNADRALQHWWDKESDNDAQNFNSKENEHTPLL